MKHFSTSDNRGVVLLISLMIMALVTISGLYLANVIINSIKSTRETGQAITSYYVAESGMERVLYVATQSRLQKRTINQVDTAIQTENNGDPFGRAFAIGDADYEIEGAYDDTKKEVVTYLPKNQTFALDLFDTDSRQNFADTRVRKVRLNWKPIDGLEWVEVSWVGWDASGAMSLSEKRVFAKADLDQNPLGIIVDISGVNQYVAARLHIKALRSGVNDLRIETLDASNQKVSIPRSRMTITATGSFESAKQALTADIPWVLPLSPLFDYAIFSESPLVK
ncbi:MAG: pilus assembly PilX N-terminal domain-containing protein [Candidatus Kerfeldbacteria bacterium]|nr:pilus assembly PilX N-terminal domain-containing protein [Candidatus Kerfeldbacteria bacterium]